MTACLFVSAKESKSGRDQCEKCVTGLIHECNFKLLGLRADGGLFDSG